MSIVDDGVKLWVCPTDRELTLRAKISSGWSFRTNANPSQKINESEQASIAQVVKRAKRLQEKEEERVKNLNERLAAIRKQACGDGKQSCILCNERAKFLSRFRTCKDCHNVVCNKCSVESYGLESTNTILLCKICSESRELIKKSNLWTQVNHTNKQSKVRVNVTI